MKIYYFLKQNIVQMTKFGLVGILNILVSYIFYGIVIRLGGHYSLANVAGYIAGTVNSFVWNNKWVFKKNQGEYRNIWKAFYKMLVSYAGTGIVLNNILLFIWIDLIGISQMIAPMINSIISMLLNFLFSKFWVFKSSKE